MSKDPLISVIIPTYNEEKRIAKCLESIRYQKYPKSKIEILIVDDGSRDKTVSIAKSFGAKIIFNGTHHIERGKSIGLEKAKGTYIFFIDADNTLTSKEWFSECIKIFTERRKVVGIESWRVKHLKSDSLINRYSSLFGVTDPIVFYLRKKGWLMHGEDWTKKETFLEDYKKYYVEKFNIENLATIGSNGYMIRKNLIKKTIWKPYLFHLDSTYDLVKLNHDQFARIKFDIKHDYAKSVITAMKKIKRNIYLYIKYEKIRRYKYNISFIKLIYTIFIMSTFVIPLIDSIRGYMKKRDIAWFINPFLCFSYVWIYFFYTIKYRFFEKI